MNRTFTVPGAAAMLVAVLAAPSAHADVDAKCYNEWNAALVTGQVGAKCKFLDDAGAQQLKVAQEQRMQCAVLKATAAEKGDIASRSAAAQADSAKRAASMDCGAETRKAFDANVTRLHKVAR